MVWSLRARVEKLVRRGTAVLQFRELEMGRKVKLKRPAGVLFDFGNTLNVEPDCDYSAGNAALLAIARETNEVTIDQVQARAGLLSEMVLPARDDGPFEFPSQAFTRLLFEPLGVVFDRPALELERIFWEASCPDMRCAPGIETVLALLAEKGIPVGVVSNCSFSGAILEEEFERMGIRRYLRFVMTSKDYGLTKPHPELFHVATAKLDVAPEKAWFCGDKLDKDIAGAQAAGLSTVWYNPEWRERTGPVEPNIIIRHWNQMVPRIRNYKKVRRD